tara:strand:- start:957 stop:1121 length:165 start_codon:yes stop_codon:yes gene_type:complete
MPLTSRILTIAEMEKNQNITVCVSKKIYIDGKEKKKSTPNGVYVIVSCSMRVDD